MKNRLRQIVEGPLAPVLIATGYLALAGLLAYGLTAWSKPEIEVMLTRLIPQLLRADFLLVAVALLLCRHDIKQLGTATDYDPYAEKLEKLGSDPNLDPAAGAPTPHGKWGLTLFFRRPGVWLAGIVLIGLLLVTQVAPQIHRIYYDEDIYANMAQNIAHTGQAGMANYGTFEYGEYQLHWLLYNKDPSGWPFLMSLAFQLFGTNEAHGFLLNNLLFAGGIVIVFFIARLLGGGLFGALLAALLYALIPHNLLWANTISAENPAAVLGGLVVLCTLVWLRSRAPRHLFLLAAVLPLACTMRPESALIALVPLAAAALNLYAKREKSGEQSGTATDYGPARPHPFATRGFWALGLIALALMIPQIWHVYAMSGQSWGAPGAKFAAAFFSGNVAVNGPYYFDNREFPLLITLLALAGLAAWLWRPGAIAGGGSVQPGRRAALLMPLWFLLFWTIFLFFYAGSYKYGADVRFALMCFMPLAVLAGLGGEALKNWGQTLIIFPMPGETETARRQAPAPLAALLVLVLLLGWLKFLPLIRTEGQEAWGARYDHRHAREFLKEIPERAIVLSHVPTMFLVWGRNAIQAYAGINNPDIIQGLMARYNGHVYFHKGYWCNTVSDANRAVCDGIAQNYDLEPVAVAREQNHEYALYRMTFKPK